MATAYTSLLGLALPVTGELSGTWGSTVNDAITSLLDTAVAGTTSITADADITLTTTTGASNQARQAIILWNPASGTVTRNITAPAQSKIYTVINASGGTQSIVFRGAGPTTGVTIIKGESAVVAWNGTDFIKVSNTGGAGSFTNVTISGTTTLSGLTASTALALDASKNVVSVTNTGTGNNVLATSPTLVTPALGTPSALTLTNATGLPVASGISGLGTGVATALAVNVGSAGAFVVNGGALGTPSSGTVTNLTGTASININGTVGATTANTGAFTTLAASGAVTLSGGTANGVTYLNGSKVLTSGSALTFDGTYFGVGGAFESFIRLKVYGAVKVQGSEPVYFMNSDNTNNVEVKNAGATGAGNGQLAFSISGVGEGMRLTSTGLGIGTSSPDSRLHAAVALSAGNIVNVANFTQNSGSNPTVGQGVRLSLGSHNNLDRCAAIQAAHESGTNAHYLAFLTNANGGAPTERMRLDSSGNLGLGVTPSAWISAYKAIQAGQVTSIYGRTDTTVDGSFTVNGYRASSGNWIYQISDVVRRYGMDADGHKWYIAPSGTAGDAISFAQAMTQDADGDLGIGTSSPANKLHVVSSGTALANLTGAEYSQVNILGGSQNFYIQNYNSVSIIGTKGASPLVITTNEVERARIDSSGNLLVGTTSASTPVAGITAEISAGGSGVYSRINIGHSSSAGINEAFERFLFNSTVIGEIIRNGASTVAYNTSSDYRLKNITGPITTSGAYIDSLNPVEGTWKADGSTFVGLIAHEVQEASRTNVATGTKDGEEMQGMDYSSAEIIANLIAEVKSLRQRLAAAGI